MEAKESLEMRSWMFYVLPKVILWWFKHGEWDGQWHVAYLGEKRNVHKSSVEKSEVNISLGRYIFVWQDYSQNWSSK
jgi:hypothetical protein